MLFRSTPVFGVQCAAAAGIKLASRINRMTIIDLLDYILSWSLYLVLSFTTCVTAVVFLKKMAPALRIIDQPDQRKRHEGFIPLVGGLAIFLAFATSLTLLTTELAYFPLLLFGFIVLVTGLVDDVIQLNPFIRIFIQALAATGMIFIGGNVIVNTGNTIGFGDVNYPMLIAVPFTLICCIGVVNSINMIDGMDGLAGILLTLSFLAMLFLFWHADHHELAKITLMLIGPLLAFLCFNSRLFSPKAAIFLGDSGSMFLGFTFAWLLIMGSQSPVNAFSPVAAGWLFGLPLADTVSVVVRRMQNGISPFHAGRDHLHHRLLASGMTIQQTWFTMMIAQAIFVLGGIYIALQPRLEPVGFWIFLVIILIYHFVIKPKVIGEETDAPANPAGVSE